MHPSVPINALHHALRRHVARATASPSDLVDLGRVRDERRVVALAAKLALELLQERPWPTRCGSRRWCGRGGEREALDDLALDRELPCGLVLDRDGSRALGIGGQGDVREVVLLDG